MTPLEDALASLLQSDRWSTAASDRLHYGQDWSRHSISAPSAVVWPETIEEVQSVVCWAAKGGIALVPSGGRTGLSGGAVAAKGEVVLSLGRMNRILGFDAVDCTLTVQGGIVTELVQNAARDRGLYYPVDFASRGSSQIGGNVATNAGGIKVLRYGMTRDWVAGLKVVTGTGELLDLNKGLVKNATGYDLRHLIIGSEGTLGIVVEATLRLTDPPPAQQVILLALPRMQDLMDVFAFLRTRLRLSAFEFFTDRAMAHVVAHGAQRPFDTDAPFYALAEFDADEAEVLAAFEAMVGAGRVLDGVIAQSLAQAAQLWRLREGITESIARYSPYKNDIAVRVSRVPAFLTEMDALFAREYPEFEVVWFGHIGDGNLHISILKPGTWESDAFHAECGRVTRLLCEVLAMHGGSISAEHGIGLLKRSYLSSSRSAAEIALMSGIKQAFDPHGILNPGKLL